MSLVVKGINIVRDIYVTSHIFFATEEIISISRAKDYLLATVKFANRPVKLWSNFMVSRSYQLLRRSSFAFNHKA